MTAPKVKETPDPTSSPDPKEEQSTTSPAPSTPSSTEKPAAHIDNLTRQALKEQGDKIAAQDRELEKLRQEKASVPAAAPIDPQAEQQKFFENPLGSVRDMIRQELKDTVEPMIKPLQEYASGAVAITRKDNLLGMAEQDSVLGPMVKIVRPALEQILSGAPEANITAENVKQAIYTAWGLYKAGQLPANLFIAEVTPTSLSAPVAPTPTNENVVIPPQVPPSAPPAPISNNTPVAGRQLTESERAMKKAFGFASGPEGDVQYLAYLDAPGEIDAMSSHVDGKSGGSK